MCLMTCVLLQSSRLRQKKKHCSTTVSKVVCKNYLFPYQLIMMGVFVECTSIKKVLIFYASLTVTCFPAAHW